jgi:hypothetical protein
MKIKKILFFIITMLFCSSTFSQSFKHRVDELIASSGSCEYISLSEPSDSNSLFFSNLFWSEFFFLMIEKELNVDFPYQRIVKVDETGQHEILCEDYPIIKQYYADWWQKKRRFRNNKILRETKYGEALLGTSYRWI